MANTTHLAPQGSTAKGEAEDAGGGEIFSVNGVVEIAEQRGQALPSYLDIRDMDQLLHVLYAVEMNYG